MTMAAARVSLCPYAMARLPTNVPEQGERQSMSTLSTCTGSAATRPVSRAGNPRGTLARRLRVTAATLGAGALLAAVGTAPASAASAPTGLYAGMGTCPLSSSALQNPDDGAVGCVVAVVNGGSFTIGSQVVTIPSSSPVTTRFGVYWPDNGPTVSFPDGNSAEIFSTVAPTDGRELTAAPIDVPIPGISNFWPGVTSAITQIEPAGQISDFTPLAAGESYPVFKLPIRLHLENAFLGPVCYVGSAGAPIVLEPTTGTTSPPPPNKPITGDPGSINFANDPHGYSDAVLGFTGATLVDNSVGVPGANGCGPFGSFDWIVDLLFGLPSAAGHNAVSFTGVNTTLAVDTSISDLTGAITASE
jgi:hypothetical protein